MMSNHPDLPPLAGKQLLERIDSLGKAGEAELQSLLTACAGALRSELERSARLLDAVETVIVGLDPQGRVTLLNRKGCELLGYREKELLGKSWFETCLPQPEGVRIVYPVFERIMAGALAEADYYENEVLTRFGQRRVVAWRNSYLRDAHGRIIGTLSAGEDITARKLAQDALRESEERFRAIFEHSAVGIGMADRDGRVVVSNQALQTMLGYSGDELARMVFTEVTHPDDADADMDLHKELVAGTRNHYAMEKRYIDKSGKMIWGRLHASAIRAQDGELRSVIGVVEDVTERKRAERALRNSEARLEQLLTSSPAVIYSARVDGDYGATFISDNVSAQTGYQPRMFTSDSSFWLDHIHPDDRPRVLRELPKIFSIGVYCHEYRFLHGDGTYRWMRDDVRLHRDADGNPSEMIGSWWDITQRKLAEERSAALLEENRRLMQRLFQLQETERKHLAQELHDELGQWLSAAQANAQSMIGLVPERTAELRASARAIIECVSQVQQGVRRMISDLRPVLLDQLGLEESLQELISQWSSLHPQIACRLSISSPLGELGDTVDITVYRIVQEALTNTARHADARNVTVGLRRDSVAKTREANLYFTIEDDGGGIAKAAGAGMGLLGMRERALAAGGTFELDNRPRNGVRISVRLPILREAASEGGG
jgi:PAS domain S-box-containing protein